MKKTPIDLHLVKSPSGKSGKVGKVGAPAANRSHGTNLSRLMHNCLKIFSDIQVVIE